MIINQFGFNLAQYHSFEEIDQAELNQVDIISIDGKIEGGIYASESMRWLGTLDPSLQDPVNFIRSKREKKNLITNREIFLNQSYEIKIVPLTEELYLEFVNLYKETTLKKERVIALDLETPLMGSIKTSKPIFIAGLFKNDRIESGLVFSVKENKQVVVFFGAKKKFLKIRGGIGGILENELIKYAIKNKIEVINHGAGRNPTGIYTNSGLFEFKSRYGFSAFPEGKWRTIFIKNQSIALSNLVFVTVIDNQISYLLISDEPEKELIKKYKTKDIKNVKVQTWSETSSQFKEFIKTIG